MITVVVPTYQRSQDLMRCLDALKLQTRKPDEVLVIIRDSDSQTWNFLKGYDFAPLPLQTVTVKVPGQVAALNAGLDIARGDIIAITDDDAAPHTEWLARIEKHFLLDERVGGVGGRDWVYIGTTLQDAAKHPGASKVVGKVQWTGRVVGNHHVGEGEARCVDVLKGANMSYRRSAIGNLRFDSRLRGTGAQVHNDLGFSLAISKAGWKLIYDPLVSIDHYLGERHDEDQRQSFNFIACTNAVYNETLILLDYLSAVKRLIFLLWAVLVGTRLAYGLVQYLRFLPKEGVIAQQKLLAAMSGRWQAWQTWQTWQEGKHRLSKVAYIQTLTSGETE